jgi:hypothetical protein
MLRVRTSILLVAMLASVLAACTSNTDETTTTVPDSTTTSLDGGSSTSSTPPAFTQAEIDDMCRTLSLFVYSSTRPSRAAEGMLATDLTDATPVEMAGYGDLVIQAPRVACLAYKDYADEVAYWLGF